MPREGFHKRMLELEREVTQMGEMVIDAIHRSVEALQNLDAKAARQVVDNDVQVNRKRWALEDRCVDLIATQQPVASDLREKYALVIVTHNMQQAARASDFTGFMYLGRLIEFAETQKIFTNPAEKLTEDYIRGSFG